MSKKIAKAIVENLLEQYNVSLNCIRLENNKFSNEKTIDYRMRINYNTGRIDQQLIMISDLKLVLKELNESKINTKR